MPGQKRIITEILVEDVQKRRHPSKHYVYVIKVTWSDGSRHVVYRRYSRFFDFQLNLLEKFPVEGGAKDPSKRIIPFLPGKILFGRSHIREVALKRQIEIGQYCAALVKLPPRISEDEEVLDFFDLEPEDINPQDYDQKQKQKAENITGPTLAEHYIAIADYHKADKWDLNLKAGMILEVIEKSDSGWWFVNVDDKQGWVPSSYLERKDGLKENTAVRTNLGEDERYLCTESYSPQNSDEVALEKGTVVDVLEKNLDGWWFVRSSGKDGYAPSTYLTKTEKFHMERVARASGVQIIGRLSEVSDIMKPSESSEGSNRGTVQHVLKKQRSLERGGSLRPPPRLNSVKKASDDQILSHSREEANYVTIAEFEDTVGDGITFQSGQVVEVIEKSDSGWWFVKINGKEGWAPTTYIEKKLMENIDEEENVYQDIGDVDDDFVDSYTQDDDYEVPSPVSDKDQWEDVPDKKETKEPIKRPVSRPPPPPVDSIPVNSEPDQAKPVPVLPPKKAGDKPVLPVFSKPVDSESEKPKPAPILPPKKISDKPLIPVNSKQVETESDKPKPVLPFKKPSNKPSLPIKSNNLDIPKPPPKSKQSVEESKEKVSSSPSIAELKNKLSGNTDNPETSGPKRYKYTEVVPKEERQSNAVDSLKNKFASKSPITSPVTSPRSETETKSLVLPPKAPLKTSPKNSVQKSGSNVSKGESSSNPMSEMKARFENKQPEVPRKPPVSSKPMPNLKRDSSISSASDCSSSDSTPSRKASALKAMFEQNTPKHTVVGKTSSVNSNVSSTTAAIASMFNSKTEKPPLKPKISTKPSSGPLVPSKSNVGQNKPQILPHKPVTSKISTPPNIPPKSVTKKADDNVKPTVNQTVFDKNHNNMETKVDSVNELSMILAKRNQTTSSSQSEEPPTPPHKDYHPLANQNNTPPTYRTICDFTSENEGEVGFTEGEFVEVVEQAEDWWLIRIHGTQGWAPASYIEPCDTELNDDVFHKQYRAISDFVTTADGEIGLCEGYIYDVIEETDSGWWRVKKGNSEGWAPSSYLEVV